VLLNAVQGISDIITVHGLVNVDFADVRTIMSEQGVALMGTGRAAGQNRALEAMQAAISSPLLEDVTIDGAMGLLVNITGGPSLTLHEVNEAVTLAQSSADPEANIIFGSVVDERMGDEVKITVIATGFAPREVPIRLVNSVDKPIQRSAPVVQRTLPAVQRAAPVAQRPAPPTITPLPVPTPTVEPRRETVPARAPAQATVAPKTVSPPVRSALVKTRPVERPPVASDGFNVGDEDQFDIPAFLRLRGQNGVTE
jgi:cell division protein FtsZ